MQEQINFLSLEVNGGYITTTSIALANTNIALTSLGNNIFSVTVTSIGGVDLAQNGQFYVLAGQTDAAENGIYVVTGFNSGLFNIRVSTIYNTYLGIMGQQNLGTRIAVIDGSQIGNLYLMTTTNPFTLGTTPIAISLITDNIQSLQDQINNLDGGTF